MKSVLLYAIQALQRQGYSAPPQELKRAYWRGLKHGEGHRDRFARGEGLAAYLILNNLAEEADPPHRPGTFTL